MSNPFSPPHIPSLRVDFNNDDDDDVIRALRKRASRPDDLYVGLDLRLEDAEGNACLGTVVKLSDTSVWVKAHYGTWIDAKPVVSSEDMDTVLIGRVRFSVDAEVTTRVGSVTLS